MANLPPGVYSFQRRTKLHSAPTWPTDLVVVNATDPIVLPANPTTVAIPYDVQAVQTYTPFNTQLYPANVMVYNDELNWPPTPIINFSVFSVVPDPFYSGPIVVNAPYTVSNGSLPAGAVVSGTGTYEFLNPDSTVASSGSCTWTDIGGMVLSTNLTAPVLLWPSPTESGTLKVTIVAVLNV